MISLRDKDVPKWTIEYNLATKKIEQFKGGGDEPVNSLPESRELVLQTLHTLKEAGYETLGINEAFDYDIYLDRKIGGYQSIERKDKGSKTLRELILHNKDVQIIRGSIELDESFSPEEVNIISATEGVDINFTQATKEAKNSVLEIKGNMQDGSSSASYGKLKHIGGDAYFYNMESAQGLETLSTIGGYADFYSLTSAQGLETLSTIGGDAYFPSLISAQGLKTLSTIGGYADFYSLTSEEKKKIPALRDRFS